MEASSKIETLVEIMRRLRNPNSGCPWDIEQNFETISSYTIEEAYEVADAIERNDMVDLKEELGDLLLQPIYHAQMASELHHFDFDDVVFGITKKLIRRHPHVFGDVDANSAGNAKVQWEQIKAEEREDKRKLRAAAGAELSQDDHHLDRIPVALPALSRAEKLQACAAEVGFDWPELGQVLDKVHEELTEFEATLQDVDGNAAREAQEEELGDLIFSLVNVARHLNIDPENALRRANLKFRTRFDFIEDELQKENQSLKDAELLKMEILWQRAKPIVG